MKLMEKAADLTAGTLNHLSRRIGRLGTYAFLDARQQELGGVDAVDLEAVLLAFTASLDEFFFVQIGSHEGGKDDPLSGCIRAGAWRGILVEPQAAVFERLRRNYADQPQLIFERAAIAGEDGVARFYRADPQFWARHALHPGSDTEISSLHREQIRLHVELFGGKALAAREDEYLRCDEVPALTLATLLRKHGVERFDFLQIDTEGFDYEVLKMVDWSRPPALVHYETVHLNVPDRIAAWDLLRSHGYRLFATNTYNTLGILPRR